MDESGCFFKALSDKGLVEKGKQAKGGQKSKQRSTVAFFVNAAGEKVDQPIVIWKSKLPRFAKLLENDIKERDIVGKVGDVSTETVTSWMERINKLI